MENEPQLPVDREVLLVLVENRRRFADFLKTRVNNPDDADEILQTAFATATDKHLSIRDEESAVAWFYRLLRNSLIDFYRKQGSRSRVFELDNSSVINEASTDTELERTVCECLTAIIPTLKKEYSELLQRADLRGEKVSDIAESLGISANNVSVRLHRGRTALRERLVQVCGACTEHGCLDCTCKSC